MTRASATPPSQRDGGAPLLVGLTFDLRSEYLARGFSEEETAELDQIGTIDALDETLLALGHRTERIGHVEDLAIALLAGRRWDLVFNVCEGLFGMGREAMVPALLDHYRIPYTFSDPLTLAVTLHKGMAKHVVRGAGIPTPDFEVVEDVAQAGRVVLPLPLFVKPVAEGTGKGVSAASIVRRRSDLAPRCAELLERFRQPVLVETLCPGRELTVGILGTGPTASAIGTLEVHLLTTAEAGVYSYVNKERCEELVRYALAPAADPVVREAEAIALSAWRALGCRDGGRVDLRCDAQGRPQFLEVNPLAGLHPEHSDLPILCTLAGLPYRELLGRIVDSARERVGAGSTAPVECAS
ncbi:MAG TPA: D-alanine--D-alanine ligase [Thermoanaerobaculia bacterium]|nr:D-alanine--D-alanine ligase [Thermoanaerobaculia bacterium]